MHTYRITSGLVTVLAMVCCLALVAFASPAVAKTIVVTTLADTADPPFDANGLCGTGTVSDLPGADGLISLREAISAANTTPGADTITFAPSLSGGTIVVGFNGLPLPALCGGQTRINGDLDKDGVPDITLDGAAFPVTFPPAVAAAAGLFVLSSHNTITGLQIQHFPFGIRILAGDFMNPGTIMHTTVTNNVLVNSTLDGILVATGDASGSLLAHTTITNNQVMHNGRFGLLIVANLFGTGSDTQIAHITLSDNEVVENGDTGIVMFARGSHNRISKANIAQNEASANGGQGINVTGGVLGAGGNTIEVRIRDNTTADNGLPGIFVTGSQDNSSNNRVVARIEGNTVERNQFFGGIIVGGGDGAVLFPTGTSNNNEVDVRIERNMVREQQGVGILIGAGFGGFEGQADQIADHNHISALIRQNVVEHNTLEGILLHAGGSGLASANTLEVRVEHNTVCHNTGADILGEGGFTGNVQLPVPNMGAENELTGLIAKNTATTIVVVDGTPGNTADVTQFKNVPCP
jgi:hypothetical protein